MSLPQHVKRVVLKVATGTRFVRKIPGYNSRAFKWFEDRDLAYIETDWNGPGKDELQIEPHIAALIREAYRIGRRAERRSIVRKAREFAFLAPLSFFWRTKKETVSNTLLVFAQALEENAEATRGGYRLSDEAIRRIGIEQD